MQRQTPLDTSLRTYVSGGARGLVHKADDTQQMQELKVNFLRKETREKAEHPQNYGFTSYCREADYDGAGGGSDEGNIAGEKQKEIKKAAEHFTQFMGGARSFPVVQNLDDRRFRCRNFDEGEVAIYDDQQQKLHIMRKRIYGRSPFKIEFRIIKDEEEEDGHGRDPKASRDQKKDESKRLSTILMDKDLIVMAKTKPKDSGGQQKQKQQPGEDDDYQNDEPEKEYKKDPEVELLTETKMSDEEIVLTTYRDGDPHLQFKLSEIDNLITMQTIRNGRPNLAWTVDEENGEVTFQASPDLIFEMDDEEKRITLRTEKGERPFQILEMDLRKGTVKLKTEQNGQEKLVIELDDQQDKMTFKTDSNTSIEMDNGQKNITVTVQNKLKLGDQGADKEAAMRGSIDTMGNRLIGALSKKVLMT